MDKSIVITGSHGFVGRNLTLRLTEAGYTNLSSVVRDTSSQAFSEAVAGADIIFHLAGANRPTDPADFRAINADFTRKLADLIVSGQKRPLIILSSTSKAGDTNDYGQSKKAAEDALLECCERTKSQLAIYRLPNIFGKWCRPNYNSAVATFCHNIARGLEISVHDHKAPLTLLYIDDLIDQWLALIASDYCSVGFVEPTSCYSTTVGHVADTVRAFRADRESLLIDTVGIGLTRALYATYVSALEVDDFSYSVPAYGDPRGSFSEMLKTKTSGQFSYFTANPGVTRGGHYHHTKTEKFMVVHGEALFRFRHMLTDQTHEIRTSGNIPTIVETIPGWSHDITNVGTDVMISLLWANEIFDRSRPDTIAAKV